MSEINDLPFKVPVKKIDDGAKKVLSEDKFRSVSRPNLYAIFDEMYQILNKKILINSPKDIEIWSDDIHQKIEKSISMLDNFLENVVKHEHFIRTELNKFFYKSRLEPLISTEVDSYMMSAYWTNDEFYKADEERFKYEDYVETEDYGIYQVFTKKDKTKFLLILVPALKMKRQEQGIFDKKSTFTTYYRLDLTEEYKQFYNLSK